MPPIGDQPFGARQAAQQSRGAGVVADLARGQEVPQRAALGIRDGVQRGAQPTLGALDQAVALVGGPPFSPAGSKPYAAPSGRSRRS